MNIFSYMTNVDFGNFGSGKFGGFHEKSFP